MALNFTVSYTFSPSTTISSSQVNTNTSDVANVFVGLEAKTKSFSNLKVDATPASSTEVAIKSYVDNYAAYRRPVLQYASGTVVNTETGLTGTSGQAAVLFTDGNYRTDSTTTRIHCNLAQVAALSGTAQSGLRTGTVVNNTWYCVYLVKVSDSSTNFVAVADTVFNTQANYATLNANFGTNSWVCLGLIRYGDQSGTANAILIFCQSGNLTTFGNVCVGNALPGNGIRMATTAGATTLTYSYSFGTAGAVIPTHLIGTNYFLATVNPGGACNIIIRDGSVTGPLIAHFAGGGAGGAVVFPYCGNGSGSQAIWSGTSSAESDAKDIFLRGFVDPTLGVGSNPML